MSECCSGPKPAPVTSGCCGQSNAATPCAPDATWFPNMLGNCLEYAKAEHAAGRPIVGIMCEYTPRELIMAAGAVPVCLCGGSASTIPCAEQELPASLCPLIKSTYGYHVRKSNPFLEMASLIVAETTCDGKKKMYELMGETRPMYVLELPQKPDDPDAFQHWVAELHKLKRILEERFGTQICDARLRQASEIMNRERALRRSLAALMKACDPPLTGRALLDLKSSISGIPAALDAMEALLAKLSVQKGNSATAGRVRTLMTGVPMATGAERVLELVEQCGGLVVCQENCTGVKPLLEDVDTTEADPIIALARKYFHLPCSVMTSNEGRLQSLRALAAEYRPQCIVELVWQGCLTYEVEANRVRRLAEQELKIPYLRIVTDYSPSDSARIQTCVEALFETVRCGRS